MNQRIIAIALSLVATFCSANATYAGKGQRGGGGQQDPQVQFLFDDGAFDAVKSDGAPYVSNEDGLSAWINYDPKNSLPNGSLITPDSTSRTIRVKPGCSDGCLSEFTDEEGFVELIIDSVKVFYEVTPAPGESAPASVAIRGHLSLSTQQQETLSILFGRDSANAPEVLAIDVDAFYVSVPSLATTEVASLELWEYSANGRKVVGIEFVDLGTWANTPFGFTFEEIN